MQFDELPDDHPCSSCGNTCAGWRRATCDAETGAVKGVLCHDCAVDADYAGYRTNKRLSTSLVCIAAVEQVRSEHRSQPLREEAAEVCAAMKQIDRIIRLFESEVWFAGGLWQQVQASGSRGLSASDPVKTSRGDASFLTYVMAGRAGVTMETPTACVSVVCAEESTTHTMGLLGISATKEEAMDILLDVVSAWQAGKIKMTADASVGLAGI